MTKQGKVCPCGAPARLTKHPKALVLCEPCLVARSRERHRVRDRARRREEGIPERPLAMYPDDDTDLIDRKLAMIDAIKRKRKSRLCSYPFSQR